MKKTQSKTNSRPKSSLAELLTLYISLITCVCGVIGGYFFVGRHQVELNRSTANLNKITSELITISTRIASHQESISAIESEISSATKQEEIRRHELETKLAGVQSILTSIKLDIESATKEIEIQRRTLEFAEIGMRMITSIQPNCSLEITPGKHGYLKWKVHNHGEFRAHIRLDRLIISKNQLSGFSDQVDPGSIIYEYKYKNDSDEKPVGVALSADIAPKSELPFFYRFTDNTTNLNRVHYLIIYSTTTDPSIVKFAVDYCKARGLPSPESLGNNWIGLYGDVGVTSD